MTSIIGNATQEALLARYRDESLPDAERFAARDRLVASMAGMVVQMARRYARGDHTQLPDLIQEGYVGVLDGIRRADSDRGTVTTICHMRINEYMQSYNSSMRSSFRLPRGAGKQLVRYIRFRRSGREDTSIEAFARLTDMNPASVECLRKAIRAVYYRVPEFAEWDGYNKHNGCDGCDMMEEGTNDEEPNEIMKMLTAMPPRTIEIMKAIYLEGLPMSRIGREWGITKERVRQIRDGAIRSLRVRMKADR